MKSLSSIEINLDHINEGLRLYIDSRIENTLFDSEDEAINHNEARFQLGEGCFYDYKISDSSFILGDVGENIIQQHKRETNLGTISPNIFVGTLSIPLIEKATGRERCEIELEVQSVKSSYREDYRDMLEFITERCTDLLLQASSPVSHHFETDYSKNNQTLYQRFAFIKSVLMTDEFAEAIHRIVTAPVTKWTEIEEAKDIRSARRFTNATTKEILKGTKRTQVPRSHHLRNYGLVTLPEKISSVRKTDSVDTPENRFIKHALEVFLKFCTDVKILAKKNAPRHRKLENESRALILELESLLHHTVFNKVSRPTTLKLNSPVLQRKEGYREILRVWLMFDLAAKLIWKGGDDVYSAGKKDIATLYEYWLFFKLLDLLQNIFDIEPEDLNELIKESPDGLNLQIKQGKSTVLRGVYNSASRKLNIRFNYNRSFDGNSQESNYPQAGSWTTTLRPDYSLSFWPQGISESDAEKEELIVHIHFDAKYKIANFKNFVEQKTESELDDEKQDNRKGKYKNADLLKMHAYKDAIRRTGGAYVLYPGTEPIKRFGFREIIPGLGAFPVQPSKKNSGIEELKDFILNVVEHFVNRTSQREKLAYRTFDIHKVAPEGNYEVNELLPESYGVNRSLIPDETFVLIGYYKSPDHYNWITQRKRKLYNFRMGTGSGSLVLSKETVSSKYLLLHTAGDKHSGDLWEIVSKGPEVYSKADMIKEGYPSPTQENYLVIEIKPVSEPELKNVVWDFTRLKNYSKGRASALPFTASLSDLMKNVIR
jgi:predicted component of viral defense system (DUF524 family)